MGYDFAEVLVSNAQNVYQIFLNSDRSDVDYGKFRDAIKNIKLELNSYCNDIVKCDCEAYKDNINAFLNQILDDGMLVYSLTRDSAGW